MANFLQDAAQAVGTGCAAMYFAFCCCGMPLLDSASLAAG